MIVAGARVDLFARGDGGTPLVAALFWANREVSELRGHEPLNLRVGAGLGDLNLIRDLGADVDADPYRGTPLTSAACKGRVQSIRTLIELGADPNRRGIFGGPDHGQGVTAIHLAAQSGQRDAVLTLMQTGADPLIAETSTAATLMVGHVTLATTRPRNCWHPHPPRFSPTTNFPGRRPLKASGTWRNSSP